MWWWLSGAPLSVGVVSQKVLRPLEERQILRDAQAVHAGVFFAGTRDDDLRAFSDELIVAGGDVELIVHAQVGPDHRLRRADKIGAVTEIVDAHGGLVADDLLFQDFADRAVF